MKIKKIAWKLFDEVFFCACVWYDKSKLSNIDVLRADRFFKQSFYKHFYILDVYTSYNEVKVLSKFLTF